MRANDVQFCCKKNVFKTFQSLLQVEQLTLLLPQKYYTFVNGIMREPESEPPQKRWSLKIPNIT